MAEEENSKTTEETSEPKGGGGTVAGLKALIPKLGLFGVVVVVGLAGGTFAGKMFAPAAADATAIEQVGPDGAVGPGSEQSPLAGRNSNVVARDPKDLVYYDGIERVTVTLNEPGMARYVALTITLAIDKANSKEAIQAIEVSKPTLIHQLTIYLAGCTLEDIRGEKNLNRVRREILDMVNNVVWPDQTPLVIDVLFKEFAVS